MRNFVWLFLIFIVSGCANNDYVIRSGSRCTKQETRNYIVGLLNQNIGAKDGPPYQVLSVDIKSTDVMPHKMECGGFIHTVDGQSIPGWVYVEYGNGLKNPPTVATWLSEAAEIEKEKENLNGRLAAYYQMKRAYHPDASGRMYAIFQCLPTVGECRQSDPGRMTFAGFIPGRLFPTVEECETYMPKINTPTMYYECLGKQVDSWSP